jgi:multiple sugar transport system substrate-binding protein
VALQEATADVVAGKSVDEAAAAYQAKLEDLVGGAANVSG